MAGKQISLETRMFRELCKDHTAGALTVITDIMADREQHPKLRMEAAKYILDQGHGKAPQFVALGGAPADPNTLGLGELDSLILQHLEKDVTPLSVNHSVRVKDTLNG
jgi:hypothetical protein